MHSIHLMTMLVSLECKNVGTSLVWGGFRELIPLNLIDIFILINISEKITDEKNTSEDWGMIMDFCDRVQATKDGPRDCLKSIIKRLNHQDPHVVIQAITVQMCY